LNTQLFDADLHDVGGTYLQHVCQGHAKFKIFRHLMEKYNTSMNTLDKDEKTLLHLAAEKNDLQIVEYLLRTSKIDVNARDKAGQTALHLAAKAGFFDIVDILIVKTTSDIHLKTYDEQTLLQLAVLGGDLDTILHLIRMNEFDLKSTDKYRNTILHSAFQSEHWSSFEVVKYLLDTHIFDTDLQTNGHEYLQTACSKNTRYFEIVRHLIEKANVNINTLDSDGKTLLHLAARSGSYDTVFYLQRTGKIDINARDSDGQTALHAAVQSAPSDQKNIYEWEEKKSLSYDPEDLPFFTVRFLVQNNIDINAQDENSFTALHLAVEKSDPVLMKYLIEQPTIDPSILNKKGQTAYDLAEEIGMEHIVSYINRSIPKMNIECLTWDIPCENTQEFLILPNGDRESPLDRLECESSSGVAPLNLLESESLSGDSSLDLFESKFSSGDSSLDLSESESSNGYPSYLSWGSSDS
jgi:ankyrin repeat protein